MEKGFRVVVAIVMVMLLAALAVGYLFGSLVFGAQAGQSTHPKYADITMVQTGDYKYAAADNDTHDAFTPTDFTVYAGQIVNLTLVNYDNMRHSFTSTDLGVNFDVPGNTKDGVPTVVHYQFKVDKAGAYWWWCAVPCDQPSMWAMSVGKNGLPGQPGYMGGYVTVLP